MLDPKRTLAIVCGAKEWPNLGNFSAADAFENSAELIRDYLIKEESLGLSQENILWLFGSGGSVAQCEMINEFLDLRFAALNATRGKGVLILFFYVGHGAFFGASRTYCLLVRDTRSLLEMETSLQVATLARLFRLKATESQRILFLDCCFAGEAAKLFQGDLDQTVAAKALEVVEEDPADRGVALLCAASSRNPAKIESPTSYTFFGHELARVLTTRGPSTPGALTLRRVCEIVRRELRLAGGEDAPRPEVHMPDQERGDLAAVPLFPNPASVQEQRPHSAEEKYLPEAKGKTLTDRASATRILNYAERAALLMTDEYRQAEVLARFAEVLAATDPDRAELIAQSVAGRHRKAPALARVAVALAATDPDRAARLSADAEHVARSITVESAKEWALKEVGGALAATDPDRAERIAQSITSEDDKNSLLARAAGALAATDLDRAERIAQSITSKSAKDWALARLVAALAATDPGRWRGGRSRCGRSRACRSGPGGRR